MAGVSGGGKGVKGGAALNINMTPMIDCTMLLVIFFLLTTEIASSNFQQLTLPTPYKSGAKEMAGQNRVIINVIPDPEKPEKVAKFQIEPNDYMPGQLADMKAMTAYLTEIRNRSPNKDDFTVVIRCDQRIEMFEVEPVFPCIQLAGILKVQLAAWRPSGG